VLTAPAAGLGSTPSGAVFVLAPGLLYGMAAVFSVGYLGVDQSHADFPRFAGRYFGC